MNTEEKSKAFAKLMHKTWYNNCLIKSGVSTGLLLYNPYATTQWGKAQFADIFLEHTDVMDEWVRGGKHWCSALKPTQENILNEVLKMEGLWINDEEP